MDFNECVSKNELQKLADDQRTYIDGNQNRGNNDPFGKAKFTMIPFAGTADPEAYLDWELGVEKKLILI